MSTTPGYSRSSGWSGTNRRATSTACCPSPRITFRLTCWRQCAPVNRSGRWCNTACRRSQWRRYDKMRRLPDGLLACGDAICSFNPIYGQGMTVAALDAMALRDSLRRGAADLPRRYFRAAAKAIGVAWQTGATSDLAFPQVEGRRTPSMRVANRLVDSVLAACESDAGVTTQFFRVTGFLDAPPRLLHPAFLYRVARVNLQRRQRHSAPRQAAVAGAADAAGGRS